MSSGSRTKPCLFSAISGVILRGGEPVKNAKIKRIVGKAHTEGKITDETTTDENGYFEMPAIFDRVLLAKILPMEFAVPQEIFVYVDGKEFDIWSGVKRERQENAESKGKPLIVECDLERERKPIDVSGGFVFSRCTWDVEPDEPFRAEDLPGPGLG